MKIRIADSFVKKLVGLIPLPELKEDEGLFFPNTKQIHTFFMTYYIDVLYLDKDGRILFIESNLKPWKIGKKIKDAQGILELKGSTANKLNLKIGYKINL